MEAWPERLAFDALIAGISVAGAALARIGIEQVVGGVAPFVLTFPAVMIATLVAGGRAGTIAALGCQLLAIRYVFPHWVSIHGGLTTDLANIILSTLALGATVWATASYRRTSAMLRSQCEHQVHTMSLLIAEMDHRTKNNFQIAAGLLAHQSTSTFDPELARELDKASDRLATIASVYQDLTSAGDARQHVDLADHLNRIVELLRIGATPEHVALICRTDPASVPMETAIITGLIVNEWVTNALKHAFGGGPGRIVVSARQQGGCIEIMVEDDGSRREAPGTTGRGSDLMASLADVIAARIEIDRERQDGTRCMLTFRADRRRS